MVVVVQPLLVGVSLRPACARNGLALRMRPCFFFLYLDGCVVDGEMGVNVQDGLVRVSRRRKGRGWN